MFLQMPPWCDITLYQMAARNVLNGGTHYRDIFDTNLPGFVWAMTAVYAVFGPNPVVLRVLDALIVTGIVVLLDRLAKRGGATPAARWWAVAGIVLFYPFVMQMAHIQRDTWMMLPILGAVALRLRRGITEPNPLTPVPEGKGENGNSISPLPFRDGGPGGGGSSPLRASVVEGALWGCAVWMKPHAVVMAAAVWLITARRLAGEHPRAWRAVGADLLGNVLGGLAVGLPGLIWLVASGTWGPLFDVFMTWNQWYVNLARMEFEDRTDRELFWFPPWSLAVLVTVPLAAVSVLDAAPWSSRRAATARPGRAGFVGYWLPRHLWEKGAGADARFVRGALGGLYLVWAVQAYWVQRGLHYVHVPETLLMFGVWATHRWAWVLLGFLWLAVTSAWYVAADLNPRARAELDALSDKTRERYVVRHPLSDPKWLANWPTCFDPSLSRREQYALRDRLGLHPPHEAVIGWEELNEVAEFLQSKGITRGDKSRRVIAWFDSPHAVYLMLDLDPGIPFMHVHTIFHISIGYDGTPRYGVETVMNAVRANVAAQPPGTEVYVVNDLVWATVGKTDKDYVAALLGPPGSAPPCELLPRVVLQPTTFPFNQPTVFRSRGGLGRYVVHRIATTSDHPPGKPPAPENGAP
jgi:hypothetical protein